jgi:hypothetical protein
VYSREHDFRGKSERFSMVAVILSARNRLRDSRGPFQASKLFLIYTPDGARIRVTIIGEFVSPEIPQKCIKDYVTKFFDLEFEQDYDALLQIRNKSDKNRIRDFVESNG